MIQQIKPDIKLRQIMKSVEKIRNVLSLIFDIMMSDGTDGIEYLYFKDKSISSDRFYITYKTDSYKNNGHEIDYCFDNMKKGAKSRDYSLIINCNNLTNDIIGEITMNDDYKLSITACKFFYRLNIKIWYFEDNALIEYDGAMIQRSITIDDILF